MFGLDQKRCMSCFISIILPLLMVVSSQLHAQDELIKKTINLPDNASAKSYGDGWSCNVGYRKNSDHCVAIKIPNNAYPTNKRYGTGWECHRGYHKYNDSCELVKVLENGYLNYTGRKWECNRGYLKVGDSCKVIKVPVNGFLKESSYAPGWNCERGFREVKDTCVALKVPKNAYISYSGHTWECSTPYIKKNFKCIMPTKN